MRQGTTPTYALVVVGRDLTNKTVFVTLKSRWAEVTKTGDDLTITYGEGDSVIAFRLTQQETFKLPTGEIEVQVRFIDAEGIAEATEIKAITNLKVLKQGVIEYAD